ncbi:MAG: hypothetical protein AAF378_10690 [Cyanobacteria bacterium P01_A01_bin.84]
MKNIFYLLIFLVFLLFLLPISTAEARYICHNYEGHNICIVKIKRSAKKYWEYKASLSIDGVKQPVETYNCRGKFKLQKDGKIISFTEDFSGKMLCGLFGNGK